MITLNLLSPSKKKGLRLTRLYVMIKNLIILILLFIIICSIILLTTKITLQNHFNEIVAQTTLITKSANVFNKDIKIFNQKLKAVENIQKEYVSWTDFLLNFAELVPNDIGVHNVTINNQEAKIFIDGLAQTRTGLLEFKGNLEDSDLFYDVNIPLDNLLEKEQIEFNVKAKIDISKLNNN